MTTQMSDARTGSMLDNKDLISEKLWSRLVDRILVDLEFWDYFEQHDERDQRHWAERIADQTLAFLRLCADDPDPGRYSPSPLVDIGWHTFILYTMEYAKFCQLLAGRFIHHQPLDEDGIDHGARGSTVTVAAMKARGIAVDDAL